MTEGEVEFVRPHMAQAGVSDGSFKDLVRQWAETGTPSFIQHLGNSGVLPLADARQLTLVYKGYVSLDVTVLFSRLTLGAPDPEAVRPPESEEREPVAVATSGIEEGLSESFGTEARSAESVPAEAVTESIGTEPRTDVAPAESMSLSAFLSSQEPAQPAATPAPVIPSPSAPIPPPPAAEPAAPAFATNPLAGAFAAIPAPELPPPAESDHAGVAEPSPAPNSSRSVSSSLSSLAGVWSGGTSSSHESSASPGGPARAEVGASFGRYTLQEMLGEGSTSRIFRAFHETLGVPVAIKVYRPTSRINSSELESKFVNEARMLARLDHPNIVRVLDVDIADHLPFIVFEYVGAMTLEELVQATGKLPSDRVAKVGIQVADALACAAEQAVLPRDDKPANVLLKKDGTAKLADIGLATMG
ncbi:MAG: serine/threonine-protein kinase, partial [Myxococcota bacterium]